MKKITGLLLAAVLCMPAYAAQTKNTMKMVSYFPVPYVAYDTVSANNAMDIGVLNQCAMDIKKGTSNLGGSACSLYLYGDPNAADLNSGLLNVAAGKLELNSNVANSRIVSKKVQIGKDMTTIGGWLDIGLPSGKAKNYDALYISSLKNTGNSFRVTSKENAAKVNSFHMFNEISNDFPGCSGTVTWKELELAADVDKNETYTDVYLVCDGTGEVPPPPDCEAPNGNRYTESCPEGQEGEIVFTWQGEPVCNYKETNNCKNKACQPPRGNSYTEECSSGQVGKVTYTWNQDTCSYDKTDTCFNCTMQASPWTTRTFTSSDNDDCYHTTLYSAHYFVQMDPAKQPVTGCTDWYLRPGYEGQISDAYSKPVSASASCPAATICGGSDYSVCQNHGGEYAVHFENILRKNGGIHSYLVSSPNNFPCDMGGPANTVVACNLPNGNIAYACYTAQVRELACK